LANFTGFVPGEPENGAFDVFIHKGRIAGMPPFSKEDVFMQLFQRQGRRGKVVHEADQFDSPWREAMHSFFRGFVEFYFPVAYRDIDWDAGFVTMETELRQIAGKTRASSIRSDSLFQVKRLSGDKQLVLFHAEVQTTRDARLAERIFRYNYRSFDAQGLPVASFGILGDPSRTWRPDHYGWSLWGCEMGIRFPVVKLIDYEGREEELAASRNPFALMTHAFLATRATQDDEQMRRHWKLQIVRRLYEQDYSEEDVRQLFRVIDWMMYLEEEQAIIFQVELEKLEAEKGMQYVTSIERLAMKKGRQEGRQEGIKKGIVSILMRLLTQRFGQVPAWVSERLEAATPEVLESWSGRLLEAGSLEEVFA
jgi:hypothetical protein